ncbi:MAG TPA: hypothetical protein VGL13_14975 [Polyangiaceae bacterium]
MVTAKVAGTRFDFVVTCGAGRAFAEVIDRRFVARFFGDVCFFDVTFVLAPREDGRAIDSLLR